MTDPADPFGTSALRAAVVAAWRDSPTRLREDAATEADLVRAGYRDRLLTELAQNAADAASKAGVPGRLVVWLDGRDLHIANTGAPLDLPGVHALTALRASGKSDAMTTVGRFGVGFTAVLTVSDEIELRSTTGSLRFSRVGTWDALHQSGIPVPGSLGMAAPRTSAGSVPGDVADTPVTDAAGGQSGVSRNRLSDRDAEGLAPPVLRLAWPMATVPGDGADTEVVLRLRDDVDADALLAGMRAEAGDLLLELPALQHIRIGTDEFSSTTVDLGNALQELRVVGPDGTPRTWWQYRTERTRWLLPLRNGRPTAAAPDVLRAPTRSDETLSLPALLIADIPTQPDRRRLLPGAHLAQLADGYADFARALPPADRLVLVPAPAFARSEADGLLREAVIRELQTHAWLPVIATRGQAGPISTEAFAEPHEGQASGPDTHAFALPDGAISQIRAQAEPVDVAVPTRASVFTGLSEELAGLLDDVVGPLVIPELSGRGHSEALGVLDVHRLGLARLAELSGGLERSPGWWCALYAALEPFVVDPLSAEELGALAVPLADGRLVTGPRTVVLDDRLEVAIPVHWARLVHPEAAHPLLARLGARSASAEELLSDPGLQAELADHSDPDTTDAVLRLAAYADSAALPAWLGLLELPDAEGELRPADELLLPDAPLRELLVEDSPFSSVAQDLVDRYGAQALRTVGVGWEFSVVVEADPTGPNHDLDDEERWWSTLPEDPPKLAAVRDLDLVDDTAWPEALWQLASGPRTRPLLTDRNGYTAWWLRTHARIDGTPLGLFRHPADTEFAGLLPEFAVPGLIDDASAMRAVLADSALITPELAAALLDALADSAKTPEPEIISRTHARLSAAVAANRLDLADLDLPEQVRALSGAVVDPADAFVLDQPWFGLALPADRLVVGDIDTASALATLLDLPLVSEAITAEVLGSGRRTAWSAEPLGVVLRRLCTLSAPDGDLVLHDDLRVRLHGAVRATVSVPWWSVGDTIHFRVPRVLD